MMRAFFAILAGFVFTLAVFVSGLAVAAWFLAAKPVQQPDAGVEVADLWTKEPRTVKTPVVGLERLPARAVRPDPQFAPAKSATAQDAAQADADAAALPLDTTVTGSIDPAAGEDAAPGGTLDAAGPDPQDPASAELAAAHMEWCASRYRSYNPEDNSYRPYSGGTRPCISPYLEDGAVGESADAEAAMEAEVMPAMNASARDMTGEPVPELGYASADEGDFRVVSDDHIAYCFSRYRSYRPEDNTYQPYGGGPRRQCE